MMTGTRARTSTSREPAVCPTYSKTTGSERGLTVMVVTSGGGMPIGPPGPLPLPFSIGPADGPQPARTRTSKEATREALRITGSWNEACW
jgi:hypothetical protein